MNTDPATIDEVINITNRLLECRKAVRKLYGTEYRDHLATYMLMIKTIMRDDRVDAITALLKIRTFDLYQSGPEVQIMIMASVVEILEEDIPTSSETPQE
jgi:hypothetical protein